MSPLSLLYFNFCSLGKPPGYIAGFTNNANIQLIYFFSESILTSNIKWSFTDLISSSKYGLKSQLRSCLPRTELTFVNHNMKIMSLGNKTELAFQLIASSVVVQCSGFASAPLHSTESEFRCCLGASPACGMSEFAIVRIHTNSTRNMA